MQQERIASYEIFYIFAFVVLLFLIYPGFMVYVLWQNVSRRVRRAVDSALREGPSARESAMAG
ncbi:hypothetical protein ABZ568_24830 [Streptomyces olindensis]|uniref:Uncharacterized protein n=1 Tax=Streptomyces olindensis TaxID=358823 RepID=A0ABV2XZX0_9ACTN